MEIKQYTLTIISKKHGKELLIGNLKYKEGIPLLENKNNSFNVGDFIGVQNFPGGKKKEGETIEETSIREVKEETGIQILKQKKVGKIKLRWNNKKGADITIFFSNSYKGFLKESNEMKPLWVNILELNLDNFYPIDKIWIKSFLERKKINYLFEMSESFKSFKVKRYKEEEKYYKFPYFETNKEKMIFLKKDIKEKIKKARTEKKTQSFFIKNGKTKELIPISIKYNYIKYSNLKKEWAYFVYIKKILSPIIETNQEKFYEKLIKYLEKYYYFKENSGKIFNLELELLDL